MSDAMRVILVDNVDSFSYNLVDEFARRGTEVEVYRNDRPAVEIVDRASAHQPCLVVISPGPGTPRGAGVTLDVIRRCTGLVPIFGVCLGHQAIVEAFGGLVGRAPTILHGKASAATHTGAPPFEGLPNPMPVGRYHSLAALKTPAELEITATSGDVVMAVKHGRWPILGVQFHPESILTPAGSRLMDNVCRWARHVCE